MSRKAVYLEIQTWIGTSAFGAEHYYGRLSYYKDNEYNKCDVTIVIDKEHAKRLNETEDKFAPKYSAGQTTIRMFSEEQVIKSAKNMWKNVAPEARLLILGTSYIVEPQRIIAHNSDIDVEKVNRINKLTELREPLEWDKDDDKLDVICDEWEQLFSEITGGE